MKRIATLVAAVALMLPASALAQESSTCQAYNTQLCTVSSQSESSSEGTLPFTGLDVVLLAAGGGTLVGAGIVVRRLSRKLN